MSEIVNDCDDIRERLNDKIERLEAEVSRLTNLAQEGENRGLEKAAKVAGNYIQSHDTRDVRSDSLKEYLKGAAEVSQKIAAAIHALIPQEQGEKGK